MTLSELLRWSGEHAGLVVWLCLIVGGGGLVLVAAYRVALAIAVLRAWWRGGSWLGRAGHPGHPGHPGGGAGGHYSSEYETFMASSEWAHQRARVLRRAGGRCQECGARAAEVHHVSYASPISATPDWALAALCKPCHVQTHARKGRSAAA